MDHTLPLPSGATPSTAGQAGSPREIIAQYFAEMDLLRDKMRRSDAAIAKARSQTKAMLEEIAQALAEMKAA